jgi:peroxiredoxin
MKLTRLSFIGLIAVSLFAADPQPGKTTLKVGDTAPDFTLPGTSGKPIKLSDFRGKKTVVLAFFPAAFTGGCTKEMTSFASDIDKFTSADAEVLPISTDNTPTLKHWAEELKASYTMLSDFQRKVSAQYGVLIPDRGLANRTTFVIDKEGKIQHIDEGTAAVDISGAAMACSRLKKS